MSFTRIKTINGQKYQYSIENYWDKTTQSSKQKSTYIGKVDEKNKLLPRMKIKVEKYILDYGDSYLLDEILKAGPIYPLLQDCFKKQTNAVITLMIHMIINGSAMYNCEYWQNANIIKLIRKSNVTSQNTSNILSIIGLEEIQRKFFQEYIKICSENESIIIDATSLPNNIQCGFNAWGRNSGSIDKQFRLLCAIGHKKKNPIYYRYLPGNLTDVSTLKTTVAELSKMGVKSSFILLDAGYFSNENIKDLYSNKINFLTRLPSGRILYKDLVLKHIPNIENARNGVRYGNRVFFIKEERIKLIDQDAYAYIIQDPERKGKELKEVVIDYIEEKKEEDEGFNFSNCGIMILISSIPIGFSQILETYYTRQSIEQIFGFFKDDLKLLPIRRHKDETVRGYLFLQFLALILYIEVRNKIINKYTVEQALVILRQLKCKVFDNDILVMESTKRQKEIFKLCNVLVPKS